MKADFGIVAAAAPGPCNISLSNGGNIDLGQINLASLSPTTLTPLPERTMNATILCSARVQVAILPIENRTGTAVGAVPEFAFGLGTTSAGKPIGNYLLRIDAVAADGQGPVVQNTNILTASQVTGPYSSKSMAPWFAQHTGDKFMAVGRPADGIPYSVTQLYLEMHVVPTITSRNTLELKGAETIDGSMTLELVYP